MIAELNEALLILIGIVLGFIIGHTITYNRAWLLGKNLGYAYGREDERLACAIGHNHKEMLKDMKNKRVEEALIEDEDGLKEEG